MFRLAIVSRDFEIYQKLFNCDDTIGYDAKLIFAGSRATQEVLENAEILLTEPDIALTFINKCKKLRWLHSTWAGNNRLQESTKQDYILTATKGIFGAQMREYVFAYILFFHRNLAPSLEQTTWNSQQFGTLEGKRLGIMGLGNIGCDVASTAHAFGMSVSALTNGRKPLDNINYCSLNNIHGFAKDCDYVVNLLPETDATVGLCDYPFFQQMSSSSVFINAGRGSVIDNDQTIIDALTNKLIRAAVLDVFVKEPLNINHPFYSLENCYVTNHCAAVSDPKKVYRVFSENLKRYQSSSPLYYQHDFEKGY